MATYEDVLARYGNGSGTKVNIARETSPFLSRDSDKSCLQAAGLGATEVTQVHNLDNALPLPQNFAMVDAKSHRIRDPGEAIKKGKSVEDAVRDGFAAGILTLSEIVISPDGQHAALRTRFVCGGEGI